MVNIPLAIFNLVPAYPLDGGRVLRAVLWFAGEDLRWGSMVAARVGQVAAAGSLFAGVWILFDGSRAPAEQTPGRCTRAASSQYATIFQDFVAAAECRIGDGRDLARSRRGIGQALPRSTCCRRTGSRPRQRASPPPPPDDPRGNHATPAQVLASKPEHGAQHAPAVERVRRHQIEDGQGELTMASHRPKAPARTKRRVVSN